VPEQETGAAALRVCRGRKERSDDAAAIPIGIGGALRVVLRGWRAGGLPDERLRLSPLFAIKNVSRETFVRFVVAMGYTITTIYLLDYFRLQAVEQKQTFDAQPLKGASDFL